MTATGPVRPFWDRTRKRWVAIQIVKGVRHCCIFFSEEAAQKWFDAPLDHPHLPLRREGSVNRRRSRQVIPRDWVVSDDGLD